jgi:hypothetical protein
MRWWLIAAVYQLQHYSQGSERLLVAQLRGEEAGVLSGASVLPLQ